MKDEIINAHEDRIIDAVGILEKNCMFFFRTIAAFEVFNESHPHDAHVHDVKVLELAKFHISNIEEGVMRIAQTAHDALELIAMRPDIYENENSEGVNLLAHRPQEEI